MTRAFRCSGILAALLLAGCASVPGAYTRAGTGMVEQGVVREVRAVTIQPRQTFNGGTLVGGAVGTAAGLALTRHARGSVNGLGAVIGGVAGGAAGQAIAGRPKPGVMVIVQTAGGRLISVVQPEGRGIYPGEVVYVVRNGADTRVVGQ